MRLEDMPRPWLLAAVTGVPMAALLRRAEREETPRPEAPGAVRDDEDRVAEPDPARSHHRVVYLSSWQ
jgi:hypothetical protein